jgi:hypothetical protein
LHHNIRQLVVAKAGGHGMVGAMPAKPSEAKDQPAEKPHYHGHRERLRERFRSAGPDAVSDYELLEMVLFTAQPRGDMKPAAKALLKKFGSFAEVMHAPETLLREVDGIGDASAIQLKLIAAAASRIAKGQLKQRTLLSSWNGVIEYCRTSMVSEDNIVFAHLGTNASNSDDGLKPQNGESICNRASYSADRAFFQDKYSLPPSSGLENLGQDGRTDR